MIALLLVALFAGGADPWLWVEREGDVLRVTADLRGLVDEREQRRLRSGLTTTLHLRVELWDHEAGAVRGLTWRRARARWELWDEVLLVEIETPDRATPRRYATLAEFVQEFARLQAEPIAWGIARDATIYQVRAVLEVNPLTLDQQAQMRRWLADPASGPRLDPVSRTLFGSFVRLFDNLRPGAAERVLRVAGHPFRADRLQLHKGEKP